MSKIGRNDPCPCGSGKKYKKCCLAEDGVKKGGLPPDAGLSQVARESLHTDEGPELDRELLDIFHGSEPPRAPVIGGLPLSRALFSSPDFDRCYEGDEDYIRAVFGDRENPGDLDFEEEWDELLSRRTGELIEAFHNYLLEKGLPRNRAREYAIGVDAFALMFLIPYYSRSVLEFEERDVYAAFGNWYIRKFMDCNLGFIYRGLKGVAAFYAYLYKLGMMEKEEVEGVLKECGDFDHFKRRLRDYWVAGDLAEWGMEDDY